MDTLQTVPIATIVAAQFIRELQSNATPSMMTAMDKPMKMFKQHTISIPTTMGMEEAAVQHRAAQDRMDTHRVVEIATTVAAQFIQELQSNATLPTMIVTARSMKEPRVVYKSSGTSAHPADTFIPVTQVKLQALDIQRSLQPPSICTTHP